MNSKKVIAIDLDDVLADSASGFVQFSNTRWGTHLEPDDYDEHWAVMWGVDQAEAERRATELHQSDMVTKFIHKEEAVSVLKELLKRFELVITTSRRRDIEKETIAWLDKHYEGIFSKIYFAGIWDKYAKDRHTATKLDLCIEVGADYLIDDQPKHCNAVAGSGIKALLFGDYKWNRGLNLPPGVTKVKDWQEVLEYFNGQD